MLPTVTGAPFLMDRSLLLLLLALQYLTVATVDTASTTTIHEPPGDTITSMCGQRRSNAQAEAGQSTRRVRCAPREDLPPELKHQYTLDQVVGIVQDIKHRLGHLQVPNIEKQRKGKGRRRPTKQPKLRTLSAH